MTVANRNNLEVVETVLFLIILTVSLHACFVTHCSGADYDVNMKVVDEDSMHADFISNELEGK
jgi:hypothetical protein